VALIIGWFIDQRRHAQMALENQLLKRDEQVIDALRTQNEWLEERLMMVDREGEIRGREATLKQTTGK